MGDDSKGKKITLFLSIVSIMSIFGYYIVTPLWVDYFSQSITINQYNVTKNSTLVRYLPYFPSFPYNAESRNINITFLLLGQWGFACIFCGVILLCMLVTCPNWVRRGTSFRHSVKHIIIGGTSMALSSLLFNYSISGSRTPLYLQGLLANFEIPLQFTTR